MFDTHCMVCISRRNCTPVCLGRYSHPPLSPPCVASCRTPAGSPLSPVGAALIVPAAISIGRSATTASLGLASWGPLRLFEPRLRHPRRGCGLKTRQPTSTQYDEKTHAPSPARISGTPGASGLRCSAHDLALFGMFKLKETTKANSILSFANLDEMHRAQTGTRGQYGLGWWTQPGQHD